MQTLPVSSDSRLKNQFAGTSGFSLSARRWLPGLMLTLAIATFSIEAGKWPWLASHGISALTLAIVFGIAVGNTAYSKIADRCHDGVGISKQNLLRLGIVLYGFRLTFQDVGHVGLTGIAIDALVLLSTIGLALLLGTRVFKLDRDTSLLVGAGSAICGAAAVMASAPVLRARAEQVAVAVSTVVVFGTLAIFLYPLLYQVNLHWQLLPTSSSAFGIYIGSTVHEVAQVVAAGRSIGPDAADSAVIAKMVRVMMLAPFLITLSIWMRSAGPHHDDDHAHRASSGKLAIPWFAFAFIGVVGLNSLRLLHPNWIAMINDVDTLMLAMAMAGLGLTTHVSAIRRAGMKPLLLASLLFGWLIVGGALINRVVELLIR